MEPIQAFGVDHIPFPSFLMLSHAGAPRNHPLLSIQLFRSAQDISKIRASTLLSFKLFRGLIVFKPFNSTGAFSLLNHFNGVSFE